MDAGLSTFIREGIEIDTEKNILYIDMNQPRTLIVKASNGITGKERTYVMRVTTRGICLV